MSRPIRVLMVEDSPSDAELIVRVLQKAGFDPDWRRVEDAPEMTAALAEQGWDVVIADYSLPQFDAPRALQLVREAELDIPFIVVSGSIGEEPAVTMMKSGAHDYLMKDRTARLGPAVERELREAEMRGERRQAVEALRKSEALYRSLVDHLPQRVFLKDRGLVYVSCNWAYAQDLGIEPEQIVGKDDFAFYPRHLADAYRADDQAVIASGHAKDIEEEYLVGTETRWVHTIKVPYHDEACAVTGVLGIFEDVTDRKRAEEEREALEAQIGHMQRLESVGRLAGGVAHDFNNLLVVIFGGCEMLLTQLPQTEPAARGRVMDVLGAAERARDLTKQLLAFSRRQVLRTLPLDMNRVVSGVTKMLRRLIGEDIEVVSILQPDLATVMGDAAQLEQVLVNLAVNARDAMPSGGQLAIETANVVLDAEYAETHPSVQPGPHVVLIVRDTGNGMDRETQKRIFEPFFTTKEEGKGTGLGLAMVYGIVKQHNGSIWVYSEPGQGTTLKVYLPVVPDAAVETSEPLKRRSAGGGETVLLVEDDEAVRKVVSMMLSAHGYRVIEAAAPERAVEVATAGEEFSLLLTDMVMPGMNGRELYRHILDLRPGVKALFMSGYTHDSAALRDMAHERLPLLEKPFTTSDLAAKVREVLDA